VVNRVVPYVGLASRLGRGVQRIATDATIGRVRSLPRTIAETDVPVDCGQFIIDNYRAVTRVMDQAPNTVKHGDSHPGNVYFRNGAAGLLDWQFVRRGHPGRELCRPRTSQWKDCGEVSPRWMTSTRSRS
jgi:hypothetical protein